VTLASHGTPEQPSPRTAQSQIRFPPGGCKFHVGASVWHELAILFSRIFNNFQDWDGVLQFGTRLLR